MSEARPKTKDTATEARWPAAIAIIGLGGSALALPDDMVPGPRWLVPIVIVALLIPTLIAHRLGRHTIDRVLGYALSVIVTLALAASLGSLLRLVGSRSGPELLKSATVLWITNILVFALWYWRLDSGGPHGRESRAGHAAGAFLFPQMTMLPEVRTAAGQDTWSPNFLDYLFLAFNTSTAFSPTDTPALARWAKLLMMVQSIISLTVLAVLAARAVNIL
jgi:hypothetical protein